MYLNKGKILIQRIVYGIATAMLTWYVGIFLLAMFLQVVGAINVTDGLGTEMALMVYVECMFLLFDVICIRAIVKTFRATKINRILEGDSEGLLFMEDVAKKMNMQHDKFVALFIDCVGRDLLQNCGIYAEDPTYILLENGAKDIREKFAVVHCPQCGAPNAVRIGFPNQCKYCNVEL